MIVEIKKDDSPEIIEKKLKEFWAKIFEGKRNRLNKFFGIIKLQEDPVILQRRWRDDG